MPARRKQYFGRQFDERRTEEAHGDKGLLVENFVSLTMKIGSTHFDHLKEIGRSSARSFRIKYLSPQLKEPRFLRGKTYFGDLLDIIQQILINHPGLRWWMEADGLVVDKVPPHLDSLSKFDRVAGPLMIEHWKSGRLSVSSLILIAARLDAERFDLRKNLQRAQWKPIATFNEERSKFAIKTFGDAVRRPQFVRNVRRRLYLSRARYQKALSRAERVLL